MYVKLLQGGRYSLLASFLEPDVEKKVCKQKYLALANA